MHNPHSATLGPDAGSGVGQATGFALSARRPAHFLGLGLSDAIVVRNVSGRVTPEVINDVTFVAQITESVLPEGPLFEVAVIHHNQCGSGALADDQFRRRYADRIGAEQSTLREHAVLDPAATVTRDVERLRSTPSISPRVRVSATSTTWSPAWWRRSSPPAAEKIRARGDRRHPDVSPTRRTVRCRSCEAGPALAPAPGASRVTTGRRWCPAHEKTQRSIVRTLLRALGHGVGVDRAEHRTAVRIHHRHRDLCAARGVKHDSVERRAAAHDSDQIACAGGLHRVSVPCHRPAARRERGSRQRWPLNEMTCWIPLGRFV